MNSAFGDKMIGKGISPDELTLPPYADPPLAEYPSLRKRGICLPLLLLREGVRG